eukprot:TRINITY_DN80008_c0_g1_i1.p1 TRINITY_DN80008_c0_g1~~TRINITY_DN80008_c0_g1_i1.p1  ORF type:complete len:457 (+),score=133.17 TRINITY_DN80008_c0_g1_i1:114-1484(+)
MSNVPVSKAELEFTLQALRKENVRIDGRALTAYRRFGLRFGAAHGEVEVNFGPSRAFAVCSGEIVTPPPERPNEGRITFHAEFGPIASPGFEVGRPSVQATTVSNFIERLLKGSKAIDAEALCIVGGQKVWSIRVDVRALDDDGNLLDVCAIAALCSILHFRKADVEVTGDAAKVYTEQERVPVPLSIHHMPVPVSFALFAPVGTKDTTPTWILDPNRLEEAAMNGTLCIALNQYGELCAIHKPGGLAVDFALLEHCIGVATARAKEMCSRIQSELEADLLKRKEVRRNVHQRYSKDKLLQVDYSSTAAGEEGPTRDAVLPSTTAQSEAKLAWKARTRAQAAAAAAAGAKQRASGGGAPAGLANLASMPSPDSSPAASQDAYGDADMSPAAGTEDRDLAAELEAVEAEAAMLEAQLRAAAEAAAAGGAEKEAAPAAEEPATPAAAAGGGKKKRARR